MSSIAVAAGTPCRAPAPVRAAVPVGAAARPHVQLAVLISLVVVFLASSSAPTPLYSTYQAAWHFSLITTTVVFGVYALAVLGGLLVLGRLSDSVGRRPVLLAALVAQIAAMLVFTWASGVDALLLARVVQGLATGAAVGAIGAAMLDVHPVRGTLANAAAPGAGTATGALVSGLVVQFLPAPTHTIFLMLAGLMAVQLVAVGRTLPASRGARPPRGAFVPQLRLPRDVRHTVLAVTPLLFAVWALPGLFGALGPSLMRTVSGSGSVVLGGISLFVLAGTASVTTLALRRAADRTLLLTGVAGLLAGVLGILAAVTLRSTVGLLAATVVAGVAFGSGFQGGLRTVLSATLAADRAGVLSLLYAASYLGMGVPAVVAGDLVVHGMTIFAATRWYGVLLVALAVPAALALRRRTGTMAS